MEEAEQEKLKSADVIISWQTKKKSGRKKSLESTDKGGSVIICRFHPVVSAFVFLSLFSFDDETIYVLFRLYSKSKVCITLPFKN